MKCVVVMQGRVRSSRLPAKGFFTFFGQTIWERMCDVALGIEGVGEIIFVTGDLPENRIIRPLIEKKNVRFFEGSENNVLERFVKAIDASDASFVIRLTCDNYLAQPSLTSKCLEYLRKDGAQYACIGNPLSHYSGEAVCAQLLREQYYTAQYSDQAKEHVTWDIARSEGVDRIVLPSTFGGIDHQNSLTLDTVEDFVIMKNLEMNWSGLAKVECLSTLKEVHDSESFLKKRRAS